MAPQFFNGADANDVESFEAMRADATSAAAANDTSAVRAVWRRARGLKRFSEEMASCGGPDPSGYHEYDLNGTCAKVCLSLPMPCNALWSPILCCCMAWKSASDAEERVVLTEKRLYYLRREPSTYEPDGQYYKTIKGALVWVAIDVTSLSDARRATPWCFCCGGHDGFVVHVDDATPKFHNHTIKSAGMLFSVDANTRTTPLPRSGKRSNKYRVELSKKYPARDCFRLSSSSPHDAVAVLADVMGAATPQVMTRA